MPLALVLLMALGAADGRGEATSYGTCVRLYAAGEFEAGVRCTSSVPPYKASTQVRDMVERTVGPFRRALFRRLIAITTELTLDNGLPFSCGFSVWSVVDGGGRDGLPLSMAQFAWELANPQQGGPPDLEFLVPWYLLGIAYNQGHGFIPAARQCVDAARPEIRRVPEMQVAEGALSEMECAREVKEDGSTQPSPSCAVAERLYRAALAQAPDLAEARLRLAKVLIEEGRASEVMELLPSLLTHPDPDMAYLARMFAARASQRLDDPDRAREFYDHAGERDAGTTSSMVGLALLAYQSGDSASARSLLSGEPTRQPDPWLWYTKGTARHTLAYRNRLRQLALSP